MTVNLPQKDYMQLLKTTDGKPVKVFQPHTDIFMEDALMAHKAYCTIHAGMRCDCHPELQCSNELLDIGYFATLLSLEGTAVT